MIETLGSGPRIPCLVMNQYYMVGWTDGGSTRIMSERGFLNGRFKEGAVAIDVECRKFPVVDVINLGRPWNPLIWSWRHKMIRARYFFGPAVQLTFDEARKEIVDLVCRRGWWSASYENEQQFKARNAEYTNMPDLLKTISFKGKWVF